jgi:hypothetical protein
MWRSVSGASHFQPLGQRTHEGLSADSAHNVLRSLIGLHEHLCQYDQVEHEDGWAHLQLRFRLTPLAGIAIPLLLCFADELVEHITVGCSVSGYVRSVAHLSCALTVGKKIESLKRPAVGVSLNL